MKRSVRKLYFTLVEILVVFFILMLGLGLTGIKINRLIHEQRFLTEVEELVDTLNIAQDLMLMMKNDSQIIFGFDDEKNSYFYQFKLEKDLGILSKFLESKHYFQEVKSIYFNKKNAADREGFSLQFASIGFTMSQGILTLASNSKQHEEDLTDVVYQVVLQGYPHPITLNKTLASRNDPVLNKRDVPEKLFPEEFLIEIASNPELGAL